MVATWVDELQTALWDIIVMRPPTAVLDEDVQPPALQMLTELAVLQSAPVEERRVSPFRNRTVLN